MLYLRNNFSKDIPEFKDKNLGGSIGLFIEVENINKWYREIKEKVKIIQDLYTTNYQTKEFSFKDVNSYVWILKQ